MQSVILVLIAIPVITIAAGCMWDWVANNFDSTSHKGEKNGTRDHD